MSGQGISAPPPSENLPTFDSSVFLVNNANITATTGLQYFLGYPDAQGTENLQTINVGGVATFYNDIVMVGVGDSITFPDSSVQTTAYTGGGGSGGAVLANTQTFTGVNTFNNTGGIIIEDTTNTTTTTTLYQNGNILSINSSVSGGGVQLGDATALNKVILTTNSNGLALNKAITISNKTNAKEVLVASDETTTGQLDIVGQVSIGNPTNTNTIILSSDGTTNNQLNVAGQLSVSNANGQISLNNTTYSHIVSMTCDDTTNVKLDINGQVQIGNSANSNTVSIQADTTNPNQFDIKGSLGLGNTLNSKSVILASNNGSTTGCNVYGDIFIYNPSATKEIQLTSNTTTSHQLDINGQLTIGNSVNSNTVLLASDSTTNNQLNVGGNIFTTGNITLGSGSTSGASLTFGDGSVQTIAYTGQAPVLATYTSSTLDTLIVPYVWSFTNISNSLGNQVNWILYSNSPITTTSGSTIFTDINTVVQPSALSNYIFGSGTAIQIPYKFSDGTTTTTQSTYYPTTITALGGFTLSPIANTSGKTTLRIDLTSESNTNFTNGSTLKLVFYAN